MPDVGEPGGRRAVAPTIDHRGDRADQELHAAYYATGRSGWRAWWTLLHPPYTAWHLGYVVIGAALAPHVHADRLIATLLAFFLAVGIAAHALDELQGRPLGTQVRSSTLVAASVAGLAGALVLGIVGVTRIGWVLIPFMAVGPLLVIAYNAELPRGMVHTDLGFALAWGAFPVLTGYVAQAQTLTVVAALAAAAAVALSRAQRALSTPARLMRRRVIRLEGSMALADGQTGPIDRRTVLAPLEQALRATSWGVVLLAAAMAVARLG